MKRIVAIGPESAGKSSLCEGLAAHYGTAWCPEYARGYLSGLPNPYTYAQLLEIAQGQWELDHRLAADASNGLYFVDTDQYVMKVWCEVVFGDCHTWILRRAARQPADLYLLCAPDLPWTPDELREYPDLEMREKLFKMYKDTVVNSGVRWVEIRGEGEERLQAAVKALNAYR